MGDFDQPRGTFVGADKYFEWNICVNRDYYSVSHHAQQVWNAIIYFYLFNIFQETEIFWIYKYK